MTDLEAVRIARWYLMNGHKVNEAKRISALDILTDWEVKMLSAKNDQCECVMIVAKVSDTPQPNVFPDDGMPTDI